MRGTFCAGVTCALIGAAVLAGKAEAQDAWEFRITPYVWAPSFELTTGLPDGSGGSNSGNILDYIAGAALIAGEARRGPWSILGEFNYLNLSDRLDPPASRLFDRVRIEGAFGSLAAGYALHQAASSRVEAYAGARFWSLETTLEGGRRGDPSSEKSLRDAIVGLRGETRIADRWALRGLVDIGGFGWDGSSAFQSNIVAAASYDFSNRISGVLGYRYLYVDLQDDTPPTLDDVTFSGPFVALEFRF